MKSDLKNCPKCNKKPKLEHYHCSNHGIKLYRVVCPNECSSTFSTKKLDCAEELWNSFARREEKMRLNAAVRSRLENLIKFQ